MPKRFLGVVLLSGFLIAALPLLAQVHSEKSAGSVAARVADVAGQEAIVAALYGVSSASPCTGLN